MLVDYKLETDLDLVWTEWGDLQTIEGIDVAIQNAVLRSFDVIKDINGSPFQQRDAARFENKLQRELNRMDDVSARNVRITAVNSNDGSFDVTIDMVGDSAEFAIVT